MFSKKKPERPRRSRDGNLSQYGLFDVPTDLSLDADGDDDELGGDSDLEAELAALANGAKPKKPVRKKPLPVVNLDAMIQDSLKDIPSDEELSGDDDPELLNELSEIANVEPEHVEESPLSNSPPSTEAPSDINTLLEERLKMYELAQANAKAAGESSRARRFGRGISTIKDLIKKARAGNAINNDDIPPVVTVNVQKKDDGDVAEVPAVPTRPAPVLPSDNVGLEPNAADEEKKKQLLMLNSRKEEYKIAALKAKRAGDNATALSHVKLIKQFDFIIKAVEDGNVVDLSNMPGPPVDVVQPIQNDQVQTQSNEEPQALPEENNAIEDESAPQLITANSVAEALQQRLDVYKQQEASAKEQGNSSKARRMGRIVKQFEQAIKLNNQGKPVQFDELPTPPGFAPIPGTEPAPAPAPEPPKVTTPQKTQEAEQEDKPTSPSKNSIIKSTRLEKQLILLKKRQKEFKDAALNAKKKGEIAQAKEFLRSAKGFDPLIEATESGLPVDISSLPVPPSAKSQLDTEYELVMADECTEDDTGILDVITRLENQLIKQLKLCLTTRDHHKALGDVAGTNRFEHLAMAVTKDLDLVRVAKRSNGVAVPKFHHENRNFSVVKSFTDLNDNDLELSIVRGINYNCANPKDIDTYVKFEFPYPQEDIYRNKTGVEKDTNNPEYNSVFVIPIERSARPCLRVFKRHAVKFEVYSKGCFASDWGCCFSGFFRGDTLLGTVTVKLQPLETQCELHDSFDLMDGRKKVGGKLEIRLRVRDPLVSKEVQQLSERWLVIDR